MDIIKIALQEFGEKEIAGIKNNPRIVQYFKDIKQKWINNDETAWCAAFVNWVLMRTNRIGTRSLTAKSFSTYGTTTDNPEIGDIVLIGEITPTLRYKHVGFFIKRTKDVVYVLGGNQSDSVNITPFKLTSVLSYRKIPLITL